MGGKKLIISIGTAVVRNWLRLDILAATISPHMVKNAEPKAVPMTEAYNFFVPNGNVIAIPTRTDMNKREITFDNMYSPVFTGDTAREFNILSLFSSSTMAPIKKSPIAAGSEKIIIAAAFSLQDWGMTKIKDR
jgi:hypothetical protein